MRLEQWSNIRNNVKQVRNELARDLDKMEASSNSYEGIVSNYPKYKEAVSLWCKFDNILEYMDVAFTPNEIKRIDY